MSDKKLEKWEVQELVDDALSSGQVTPDMVNEYVYEFKQGGRVIQDLTAASYAVIALEQGINTKEIVREDMPDGVLYTVTVEKDGQERYGVAFQAFIFSGKFDVFCYQKALTKATRNGIKQFVNATQRFDVISKLKALPMSVEAPQAIEQKPVEIPLATPEADNRIRTIAEMHAEPEPKTEAEREGYLRRYCFALWNEHNPLTGDGRVPTTFWDNVKDRFEVESRTDMTVGQWQACLEQMKKGIGYAKPGQYAPAEDFSIEETHSGLMQPEDSEAETTEIGGNGE